MNGSNGSTTLPKWWRDIPKKSTSTYVTSDSKRHQRLQPNPRRRSFIPSNVFGRMSRRAANACPAVMSYLNNSSMSGIVCHNCHSNCHSGKAEFPKERWRNSRAKRLLFLCPRIAADAMQAECRTLLPASPFSPPFFPARKQQKNRSACKVAGLSQTLRSEDLRNSL